jgi:hypothetical protein
MNPAAGEAPPVRPVVERLRDYAIIAGTSGGIAGACLAARHEAPMLGSTLALGGGFAATVTAFLALRHALIQDRWEQDHEMVSAVSAGTTGGIAGTALFGPRTGSRIALASALAGCILHYGHRWWLHERLRNGW